jgi:predicted nucleotidyltransferase
MPAIGIGKKALLWLHWPVAIRIEDLSAKLKRLESRLRGEFHVRSLHVFGSVARGDARDASALDILVEFEGPGRFAQFMDLKFLLEDECGVRVDLVTKGALRPAMKAQVLAEAKRVA